MTRLKFHLYTSFVVLYMVNLFANNVTITYIQGLIGIFALVISIYGASKTYQIIGVIFTVIASLLFVTHDIPITNILPYFTSMGLLLSLLYVIPFINHYMIVGRFDQSLYKILQSNTPNLGKFYTKSYLTSYALTLFIFISMIPMSYQFIKDRTKEFNDQVTHQFATRSVLRPLATANVWSPIEVYTALVVAITGAYYLQLLPVLLAFSIIMVIIDLLINYNRYKGYTISTESGSSQLSHETIRKLILLVVFLVLFVTTATVTHLSLNLEFFDAIVLIIIPYTLVWALATKRFTTLIRYNQKVWDGQLWTMQNFMMLLLPVGFFNEVVTDTGVFDQLLDSLSWLQHQPLLLFIFIMFSSMTLAFFGFHPLVTLSLIGLFVTPFLDTISPLSISVVMIISVVLNDMTGTFNIPITMLNQYFKRNPYQLTLWNIGYALIFGNVGILIGYLLNELT
ncbi:hypothetical protein [Alkalibacillus haloalkaliphilus]|uniref:hypothetical protein n=1 Tax=Alkalibacillus haloalkaliphilus TaxID=94136 RepID=UPI0003151D89|nr:hypothetical protein [Alkalibacillus haloalkaliphilus]